MKTYAAPTEKMTEIVAGNDLVMVIKDNRIALHHNEPGRRLLGNFASAAEAWEALDTLDLTVVELNEAIAA